MDDFLAEAGDWDGSDYDRIYEMHFTPDGHGSYEYKPDGSNYDKRQAAAAPPRAGGPIPEAEIGDTVQKLRDEVLALKATVASLDVFRTTTRKVLPAVQDALPAVLLQQEAFRVEIESLRAQLAQASGQYDKASEASQKAQAEALARGCWMF